MEDEPQEQSLIQKKIAFANNPDAIQAVMAILKESASQEKLVGDTEFETIKNAITLDAQAELMIQFVQKIDFIKAGGLVSVEL